MSIYSWLKSRFSSRRKDLLQDRSGMPNAHAHEQQQAIDCYTNSIDLQDAPADAIALARYNRALVYMAVGDFSKGADDLDAVLQMTEAPPSIKKMARRKLAKRRSRSRETPE